MRIEGSIYNLFVVVVYIPHMGRVNPSAQYTIEKLKELLITIRKHNYVILIGDFNCQMRRNVQDCTGN